MRDRGGSNIRCAAWAALILWALLPGVLHAELPLADAVRFRSFGVNEGMSQATARDLAVDAQGFLWIGTQDGLNRFDGEGFRVFKHVRGDPQSLAENYIGALAFDTGGKLWIATRTRGLNEFDPRTERFRHFVHEGPEARLLDQLDDVLVDARGMLWLTGVDGVQERFDPVGQKFLPLPFEKPAGTAPLKLLAEAEGMLLLANGSRLYGWRANDNALRALGQLPVADVEVLCATADGARWWLGTRRHGLWLREADGELVPFGTEHSDVLGTPINALLQDALGDLWIGTESGLAHRAAANAIFTTFHFLPGDPFGLPSGRVQSLAQGDGGRLWIGTWTGGFALHDPASRALALIRHRSDDPRSLPINASRALLRDADGMWVALSGAGVVQLDKDWRVRRSFLPNPADPHAMIARPSALARTPDGTLWVGTVDSGLARLRADGTGFDWLRHDADDLQSLGEDAVTSLYVDPDGALWVGGERQGLSVLCEGCKKFRHYLHETAIDGPMGGINAVLRTRRGEYWVAVRRSGLIRLDPSSGKLEQFRYDPAQSDSFSHDSATDLFEDSKGRLWICTQGGGLNELLRHSDGRITFRAITTQDGLGADAVGALREDRDGRLWVSTTEGVTRYDPSTGETINFGLLFGVRASSFIGSVEQDEAGTIYFGGIGGIFAIDPIAAGQPHALPHVLLTDVQLFNRSLAPQWRESGSPLMVAAPYVQALVLDHRQSVFTFAFSSLSYVDPRALRYQYRLDGLDNDWLEAAVGRPSATYTRLASGDYTFRARAALGGGEFGPASQLAVHLRPAPWLSAWAMAGYVSAAFLLVAFALWRLSRAHERREAVRETLRLSEERLKLALWASGAELWDVDLPSGRLHRENRLEHLAATVEADNTKLRTFRDFVHPDDLPALEKALAAHLKGTTPAFEASYRTPNLMHDWVWLLTRGRVVERDARGHAVRISGTSHDISMLKQAEQAMRELNEQLESRVEQRTAALQSANRKLRLTVEQLTLAQRQLLESEKLASLGGMVAGIAHEINTPLGIGVTAASHLQEEFRRFERNAAGGGFDTEQLAELRHCVHESSDLILRNLQRADRLIKSFKRVAVDQTSEEKRVVDLRECLNDILVTLGPTLKKTPHHIALECPSGVIVTTAPGALHQVITNLVMNSLAHGFTPGQPGNINIHVERRDADIVLDYRDDGQGMEESVRKRVFEPFVTTKRGRGGSGLGGFIVYSLVTQVLAGSIECDSAPGQGVHFEMKLPNAIGG